MASQHGSIAYRGTLPLSGLSTFHGEAEAREGSLLVGEKARRACCRWRCRNGAAAPPAEVFRPSQAGVELTQSAEGECLFAPLFVDLNRKRLDKAAYLATIDGRTTAGDRAGDVAVGYRAQIGKAQWLIYRSLAPAAIRTVLGQNLMHEFLVGRFHADGHVDTLLEIE